MDGGHAGRSGAFLAGDGARGRALVVDDEPTNRLLLKALLGKDGFEVDLAENGRHAVERFAAHRPDIVFMDIMMPEMDGYEATRQIKDAAGDDFIPVIFLTAFTEEDALARCIEVGGDDFLTKPYSKTLLRSKVQAMERIRDLHREVRALHGQMLRDEEIARGVFDGAVVAGNAARDRMHTVLRPAALFSGDVLLSAYSLTGGLNVLLGDFTGHGLAAALGALPTSEVFRAMSAKGFSGEEILVQINRKLYTLLPTGMFLAAGLVVVSEDLRRLEVWNGGMPDLLLIDGESGAIRERLASHSIPLGIQAELGALAEPRDIRVVPGDRMLMVSDGLAEARDPRGEAFGEGRVEQALGAAGGDSAVDGLLTALDAFCGSAPQDDDITVAEIPLVPEVLERDERAGDRESVGRGGSGPWAWSLELRGERLRELDPVPIAITQVQELEGLPGHRQALFTVLTELYNNALDHGVLGLSSRVKDTPEGFGQYLSERERRLEGLDEGWVRLALECTPGDGGGRMLVRVSDSGPGFDFQVTGGAAEGSGYHGRGLALVGALCQELRYDPEARCVEAVYVWRRG